jgi:muramoyltetrapeptide carboxypeptidase LdcA involved in peptidoglycan recycling
MTEYNPGAPVVWGVELGHTDPQHVVPSGGQVTIDATRQRVHVRY